MTDDASPGPDTGPDEHPWRVYLRGHEGQWHKVAVDVPWAQYDQLVGAVGLAPADGFTHSAETVLRDPDSRGLAVVNVWGCYRRPGTHEGLVDADGAPREPQQLPFVPAGMETP